MIIARGKPPSDVHSNDGSADADLETAEFIQENEPKPKRQNTGGNEVQSIVQKAIFLILVATNITEQATFFTFHGSPSLKANSQEFCVNALGF